MIPDEPCRILNKMSKVNKRADRVTYNIIKRDQMERGNVYAEFQDAAEREDFDPVVEVDYDTASCPICGADGEYDEKGFIVCQDKSCGGLVNSDPMILPPDDKHRLENAGGDQTDLQGSSVGVI